MIVERTCWALLFGTLLVVWLKVPVLQQPWQAEHLATLGASAFALLVLALRLWPNWAFERLAFAIFLAAMPLVYLLAALVKPQGLAVPLELAGCGLFIGLAWFAYHRGVALLALGVAAHGLLWDLWHGNSLYIAAWYALACLLIDLAFAGLLLVRSRILASPTQ